MAELRLRLTDVPPPCLRSTNPRACKLPMASLSTVAIHQIQAQVLSLAVISDQPITYRRVSLSVAR